MKPEGRRDDEVLRDGCQSDYGTMAAAARVAGDSACCDRGSRWDASTRLGRAAGAGWGEPRGTGVMSECASAQRGARRPEDEEVVAQHRPAQRRCSAGPCDARDTARASPSRATARRSVCRCRSNLAPLSASRLRRYPPSRSPIRRAVSPDHVCCPRWRSRSSRRRGSATRPESPQAPDRRTMGQRALARATCGE